MALKKTTRRDFIRNTGMAGAGLYLLGQGGCALFKSRPEPRYRSPNEKLNIACIGVGGRGGANLNAVSSENIVAICDVDEFRLSKAAEKHPKAKKFHDFRKIFDTMSNEIDAVVVSTPDHMHALPAMMAMSLGMHVYCEKPLTHDVYEARRMAEMACEYGVATQMGNQGTASEGFRRGVEMIRSGALGKVTQVHVWTNRPVWPQGIARPAETPAIPDTLEWDLWLGTAPKRAYNPIYHPFNWRGWWDFGTGALGDMGCHTANMAFMALDLGSPLSAEARNSDFIGKDSFPTWSVIDLEFPARKKEPPVTWTWYDGGKNKPKEVIDNLKTLAHGKNVAGSGLLVIGDKGTLYSPNDYGSEWTLLPEDQFKDFKAPAPTLPPSPGHHKEWIDACKGIGKPMSHFGYGGPLTETLLLGNVAMYVGKKIEFDGSDCEVTNCDEAQALIRRNYREGWDLI